jgi:hypothetical protein
MCGDDHGGRAQKDREGELDMKRRTMRQPRNWFLIVAALVAVVTPMKAKADMGLKCSQWLESRKYFQYDARTETWRDARPSTAPPVSREVDEKGAWANWYIFGYVMSRALLDVYLAKHGDAVGVTITPVDLKEENLRIVAEVEKLCRRGLQQERKDYDVANVIDDVARSAMALRVLDVTTMLEHAIEIGKRLGLQQRQR